MWRELEKCTFNPEQMQGAREAFHCPLCHEMLIPGKPHHLENKSDFDNLSFKSSAPSNKKSLDEKHAPSFYSK